MVIGDGEDRPYLIAERESVWSGFLCTIDGAKGRELERRGLPYLALDGFLGADVIPTASLAIGGLETGHGSGSKCQGG